MTFLYPSHLWKVGPNKYMLLPSAIAFMIWIWPFKENGSDITSKSSMQIASGAANQSTSYLNKKLMSSGQRKVWSQETAAIFKK